MNSTPKALELRPPQYRPPACGTSSAARGPMRQPPLLLVCRRLASTPTNGQPPPNGVVTCVGSVTCQGLVIVAPPAPPPPACRPASLSAAQRPMRHPPLLACPAGSELTPTSPDDPRRCCDLRGVWDVPGGGQSPAGTPPACRPPARRPSLSAARGPMRHPPLLACPADSEPSDHRTIPRRCCDLRGVWDVPGGGQSPPAHAPATCRPPTRRAR